jgi:hypothetical protein
LFFCFHLFSSFIDTKSPHKKKTNWSLKNLYVEENNKPFRSLKITNLKKLQSLFFCFLSLKSNLLFVVLSQK